MVYVNDWDRRSFDVHLGRIFLAVTEIAKSRIKSQHHILLIHMTSNEPNLKIVIPVRFSRLIQKLVWSVESFKLMTMSGELLLQLNKQNIKNNDKYQLTICLIEEYCWSFSWCNSCRKQVTSIHTKVLNPPTLNRI